MNSSLPFTYRKNMTVTSEKYLRHVKYQLDRLREKQGSEEMILRLECISSNTPQSSPDFEIGLFAADDGQAIYYNKWKSQNPEHIFICINGLESHGGWFSSIAGEFVEKNIVVYAVDRRGSGLNSRNYGSWQDWLCDIYKMTKIARKENPSCKVHLLSICFGAKVATACVTDKPDDYDSLIYMSPGIKVKVEPSLKEKLQIGVAALPCFSVNIPSPIKNDDMFTDSVDAKYFLFQDKLRTHSPRASDFYQGFMLDRYIRKSPEKVRTPSLVLMAANDKIVNNSEVAKYIDRFSRRHVIIEYPSEHIIFFGQSKDNLISDIIDFINNMPKKECPSVNIKAY